MYCTYICTYMINYDGRNEIILYYYDVNTNIYQIILLFPFFNCKIKRNGFKIKFT